MEYRNNLLYMEEVALDEIAESVGTPVYVYSAKDILGRFRAYDKAFGDAPHRVCYAVKANSNLSVLGLLNNAGAGFDIVSGGELYRVLKAGGDPAHVVFSGVGKTREEIEYALENGIHTFNCESEPELALIDGLAARLGKKARIALRVNPDVDASTHPYISTGLKENKFGIDIAEVEGVYMRARSWPHLLLEGVSCHIGSQVLNSDPLLEAVDRMLALVERLRAAGLPIQHLDLGGGIGVPYKPEENSPSIEDYIGRICAKVKGANLTLMVEPGRSIVAEAGVLLSRVLYRKRNGEKDFVIIDAAMNDLIRPALYKAHHEIIPLRRDPRRGTVKCDVVGPVCESGDFLAKDRELANVMPGDLVAICTAGAYGFVQASNYNSRPRAAEIMVGGSGYKIARTRESYHDLVRGE